MNASDELRRMLDERGVEWKAPNSCLRDEMTMWTAGGFDYEAFEVPEHDGTFLLTAANDDLTTEQAIDATLGRGECRDEGCGTIAFKCSECGCWVAYDEDWSTGVFAWVGDEMKSIFPHYCPNCGAQVVDDSAKVLE